MAKINLLPWREALRKQQQQRFFAVIGAATLASCFLVFLIYLYIEDLKDYQTSRNSLLKNEIAVVDKKIQEIKDIEEKKSKLLSKIELIQKLQESRPEVVHLFDELAKITPDGVYLSKFSQLGDTLTLEGKAESNARVSALMRAIDSSPWLNSSVLGVIKSQGKTDTENNDFTLTAKQGKKIDERSTGAGK
jgi:type IV pilus assembly protein PilN